MIHQILIIYKVFTQKSESFTKVIDTLNASHWRCPNNYRLCFTHSFPF